MKDELIDQSGWNYTIVDNSIIENNDLDIYEKMLYISLKRFSNIQTGQAFPGVKKLSNLSGMSERKARSVLSSLTEKGLLNIKRRTNQTNLYTILKVPAPYAGGAHSAGEVVHTVQGGGAHHADELQKLELQKDELQKDKVPYVEIVNYLNAASSKNYRATTSKTQTLINARFKEGFTVDDFKRVIDVKTKQWLNHPKNDRYLRPETLFGTKFEGYLNEGGVSNGANSRSSSKGYEDGIDF